VYLDALIYFVDDCEGPFTLLADARAVHCTQIRAYDPHGRARVRVDARVSLVIQLSESNGDVHTDARIRAQCERRHCFH